MVVPENSARTSRLTASVVRSGMWKRGSGTRKRAGTSQAGASTATTISGGKDRGPAPSGAFCEASQAVFEEAFAPLRDDLPASVETGRDLVVAGARRGQQHDLGAPRRPLITRL